jgi:hypothetical protein
VIIFDLKCEKGHKFEGWFKDRAALEEQQTRKLISCPICGSAETVMVPSSITIVGKNGKIPEKKSEVDISPMKYLQAIHQHIEEHFENVGERFTEVALKIHYGDEDQRNIRGTTTLAEEETLKKEGVPFIKIPEFKFDS